MDRFETYGASHLSVVALGVVGALVLVAVGRSHRGEQTERPFGRAFAVTILAFTIPLQILSWVRFDGDAVYALPLQLCDLASLAAPYALWTQRRWAVGLTYFWGLTLTTQAVVTPDLTRDFPDPVFITFWGMHLLVVWAACYLTWGIGLAPRWREYRVTVAVTAVWAVALFSFNAATGTNYGYLNEKPAAASALDLLGEWPWYLVSEVAIILAVWALLTWPWVTATRRRTGRDSPALREGHTPR